VAVTVMGRHSQAGGHRTIRHITDRERGRAAASVTVGSPDRALAILQAMPSARRWQPEPPDIRASDAERERVVAFLRDNAAEGRLTADELDERVGRAYAAVTRAQFAPLVRDLPRSPAGTSFPRPPRRHAAVARPRPVGALGRPVGFVFIALAALAALRLPGLILVLVWTGFAVSLALVAVVAVLALALSPVIALVVLAVVAVRRRAMRSWAADA